jgi:hypothetical protein
VARLRHSNVPWRCRIEGFGRPDVGIWISTTWPIHLEALRPPSSRRLSIWFCSSFFSRVQFAKASGKIGHIKGAETGPLAVGVATVVIPVVCGPFGVTGAAGIRHSVDVRRFGIPDKKVGLISQAIHDADL